MENAVRVHWVKASGNSTFTFLELTGNRTKYYSSKYSNKDRPVSSFQFLYLAELEVGPRGAGGGGQKIYN